MTETIVRLAVPEDREGLLNLCVELHDENGLFPISIAKVGQMLDRAFDRRGAIIGVIGDVGAPTAAIYLALDQMYYSEAWFLNEGFNFVHPDHRHSDYARQLIAYAKVCSDKLQVPLMMGILSNHRTESKTRFYERQLDKAGAYFVYNRQLAGPGAWDAAGD